MQPLRPLCSWCLVVVNASLMPIARGATEMPERFPASSHPSEIRKWAERILDAGGTIEEPFGVPGAFEPVGTWHGDPVCGPHLTSLVMESWRDFGEPRKPRLRAY